MSALSQYIDLVSGNKALVESNSAAALNNLRHKALIALNNIVLPAKGSENYEITDLDALLSPDYGINLARVAIDVNPAASFKCDVPNMTTALALNINDSFHCSPTARNAMPQGILMMSFRDAERIVPDILEKHYGQLADIANPIVALNSALAEDGCLIYVTKGCKSSKPLQLVNILNNGMPLMAIRRLLIVAEEDTEFSLLLCDHTQNPEIRFLNLQVIEIFAGRNSKIDIYDLEESSQLTTRLSALYLKQEENSNVLIDGITLYNGVTRNEYHTQFCGKGASLQLLGMGIEDKKRQLDTYSFIKHEVGHCNTQELFKYVVDQEATGAFTGTIYVAPGSEKTEAYQTNRNLVGDKTARMFAKPQLEIYNDDVKCSHGTAIGQLDEMQLFYMRTRGISESTARLLLKQAFMMDVIDGIRFPQLRERLRHLVECRFEGKEHTCANCKSFDANRESVV